jgi:hypothetical protein
VEGMCAEIGEEVGNRGKRVSKSVVVFCEQSSESRESAMKIRFQVQVALACCEL